MADRNETRAQTQDKPYGTTKFLKNYASFTLLMINEWLLHRPSEGLRSMLRRLI